MNEFSLNLTFLYLFSFGPISVFAFTEFEEEFLKIHNDYRKRHKAPPLKLNQELCNYAKEWAEKLAEEGSISHRPEEKYGENVFWKTKEDGSVTKADAKEIIDDWYEEVKNYNFKKGTGTGVIGHFTQIVWKSSQELGVGVAHKNGGLFVVANYKPGGNMRGKYIENVLLSTGKSTLINIKILIISLLIVNTFAFI